MNHEKELMLAIFEKEHAGEITVERRNHLLQLIKESSDYIENNIKKIEEMFKAGKITKEERDKQITAWEKRRENYEDNIKRQKENEEAEKKANEKKLSTRIKNKFAGMGKPGVSGRLATVTESEEYTAMKFAIFEREHNGEISIDDRNRLIQKLDEVYNP